MLQAGPGSSISVVSVAEPGNRKVEAGSATAEALFDNGKWSEWRKILRLEFKVGKRDVARISELQTQYGNLRFVQRRISRNVERTEAPKLGKGRVWDVHVGCLLTTQQPSGPDSPLKRLLDRKPFPLSLAKCRRAEDVERHVIERLQEAGGIRRYRNIAKEIRKNLEVFESPEWKSISSLLQSLCEDVGKEEERIAARAIQDTLKGMGPKQARNFLQWLGLTRQEIPLDSRVARWLRKAEFPIPVSASALGDTAYYEFVLDHVQLLCEAAGILPCVFDAMVFAAGDKKEWDGTGTLW